MNTNWDRTEMKMQRQTRMKSKRNRSDIGAKLNRRETEKPPPPKPPYQPLGWSYCNNQKLMVCTRCAVCSVCTACAACTVCRSLAPRVRIQSLPNVLRILRKSQENYRKILRICCHVWAMCMASNGKEYPKSSIELFCSIWD